MRYLVLILVTCIAQNICYGQVRLQDNGIALINENLQYFVDTTETLSLDKIEQEQRDVAGNHNAFSIITDPSSTESILVRIESENFITATATLYDEKVFREKARKEYTFLGMFYGILILVTFYSLFMFVITRMRLFLIYAAYIIVCMLVTGILDGFTSMLFTKLIQFSQGYIEYTLIAISYFLSLFFTDAFLKTKEWSKPLNKILNYSAYGVLVLNILILVISPGEGFEAMNYVGIAILLLILVSGVLAFKNGVQQAGFFLWSFMAYGIFIIIFTMNLLRMIPFGFLSQYALHFGIITNLLILSIALGNRIRVRYKASYNEVESAKELYSIKNQELEKLVWERTKEVIYKENELRSIIDNSDNHIWLVDKDHILHEMNKSFAETWELTYGFRLRKGESILDQASNPEEIEAWKKRYDTVFNGETANFFETYEVGDEKRFYEINAYPIWENGNVMAATIYSRDITDRIRYQNQLEEKNAALQKANDELDSFVYSASHDLKAPLASIQGLIGLARNENTNETLNEYFVMIERSIKRLDQFIRDIIDYSRNSRIEIKVKPLEMNKLINDILEDLRFMSKSNDVDIKIEGKGIKSIASDETRLKIILRNLISNAIQYGKPEHGQPVVHISWNVTEDSGIIKVADNGRGIVPEHLPHIFEMFYRANETASGSGLGLYIVNESLNKMGGTIEVNSRPGEGTTFTVVIPNKLRDI
ncbi:MAG: 7TM diverse intracellular signaling domain-containing protein [Cyclobacteriaceae bacterium]